MKILIAEDDLVSRKMLEGILVGWGYEVVLASNGNEAWRILQEKDAPQLAILDWVMPGLDGLQLSHVIRQRRIERYIYVVLVTAKAKKDDIIRGLETGADDYLIKPYDPLELKARLISGRRILDLQEELISAREIMRHQATRDFLTGAWNHRAIMEILDRELSRSQREAYALGIIMVDLDHFKKVNDTHGHLAGDTVLREVGRRMDTALRPYDLVGRWGGEEFLAIVPRSNVETTMKLAERLRLRIAAEPITSGEHSILVTASFGIAVYNGIGSVQPHTLLNEADVTLYKAKDEGRNRVQAP